MPVMSGMEAIRKLSVTHPKLPIIILTTYNEDQLLAEGFALGAKGYLLKRYQPPIFVSFYGCCYEWGDPHRRGHDEENPRLSGKKATY